MFRQKTLGLVWVLIYHGLNFSAWENHIFLILSIFHTEGNLIFWPEIQLQLCTKTAQQLEHVSSDLAHDIFADIN